MSKNEVGAKQKIRHDTQFGANIRMLRKSCKLTQGQVITQMQLMGHNISRETYAKIESGIANIKVSELLALKKIFRVELDDFFKNI